MFVVHFDSFVLDMNTSDVLWNLRSRWETEQQSGCRSESEHQPAASSWLPDAVFHVWYLWSSCPPPGRSTFPLFLIILCVGRSNQFRTLLLERSSPDAAFTERASCIWLLFNRNRLNAAASRRLTSFTFSVWLSAVFGFSLAHFWLLF